MREEEVLTWSAGGDGDDDEALVGWHCLLSSAPSSAFLYFCVHHLLDLFWLISGLFFFCRNEDNGCSYTFLSFSLCSGFFFTGFFPYFSGFFSLFFVWFSVRPPASPLWLCFFPPSGSCSALPFYKAPRASPKPALPRTWSWVEDVVMIRSTLLPIF